MKKILGLALIAFIMHTLVGSFPANATLREGFGTRVLATEERQVLAMPIPGIPQDVESSISLFFNIRGVSPAPTVPTEWLGGDDFQVEEKCLAAMSGVTFCQ